MRAVGEGYAAGIDAARTVGLVPRDLISITVRDEEGEAVTFNLWSGDYPTDISVISGTTGGAVTRSYVGGVNLEIGEIEETSELTIRSVDVSLSGVAPAIQSLLRGHDARLARVEIHSLLLDPETRDPLGPAEIVFLGIVDNAPISTGAAGSESLVKFTVIDDAMLMLTRTSAAKRSDERQVLREGDRLNRYSNVVGQWQVFWGERPS